MAAINAGIRDKGRVNSIPDDSARLNDSKAQKEDARRASPRADIVAATLRHEIFSSWLGEATALSTKIGVPNKKAAGPCVYAARWFWTALPIRNLADHALRCSAAGQSRKAHQRASAVIG
jgi:hypothetical protein